MKRENIPVSPVQIAEVGLKVKDAAKVSSFYREVIGLSELSNVDGVVVLGVGNKPLVTIRQDASAVPDDPRAAGLFHTAFLLPTREDLARWVRHASERKVPLDGASDHLVSEAVYLHDPEGNGIEIYADRPREEWTWQNGEVAMETLRLDLQDLLSTPGVDEAWHGMPEGTTIGHMHLRVGDPALAEKWWHENFSLDTMARYGPQAVFLASGGYHHHIGANSWHSAGAGMRDPASAGLEWLTMEVAGAKQEATLEDPWGTVVRVTPGNV